MCVLCVDSIYGVLIHRIRCQSCNTRENILPAGEEDLTLRLTLPVGDTVGLGVTGDRVGLGGRGAAGDKNMRIRLLSVSAT